MPTWLGYDGGADSEPLLPDIWYVRKDESSGLRSIGGATGLHTADLISQMLNIIRQETCDRCCFTGSSGGAPPTPFVPPSNSWLKTALSAIFVPFPTNVTPCSLCTTFPDPAACSLPFLVLLFGATHLFDLSPPPPSCANLFCPGGRLVDWSTFLRIPTVFCYSTRAPPAVGLYVSRQLSIGFALFFCLVVYVVQFSRPSAFFGVFGFIFLSSAWHLPPCATSLSRWPPLCVYYLPLSPATSLQLYQFLPFLFLTVDH